MANDLVVRILGDSRGLTSELDKAKAHLSTATSSFAGMSKVAGIAGLAIGGGLVGALGMSVKAAMAGQVSQAQLTAAVKATGQSVSAMTPALDAAQASARNLGFSNDDSRVALAKLEVAFKNTKTATYDLGIAENLARFKHVDLATATTALAMAHAGSTKALKQLGIAISPVTTALDDLKAAHKGTTKGVDAATIAAAKLADKMATGEMAIGMVSKAVNGQAKAFAGTAEGGMAVFHAQMTNIEENIGTMLLPAMAFITKAVSGFTSMLSENPAVMKIVLIALGALAVVLMTVGAATKIYAAGAAVVRTATALWTAAQWLLNAALTANPIGIVVIALAALGVALYLAWTRSGTFRDFVRQAFADVTNVVQAFVGFFTRTLPAAFSTVINWLRGNWPVILMIISGPFLPLVALATNAFGIRQALINAFMNIINDVRGAIGRVAGVILALPLMIIGLGAAVVSAIVTAIMQLPGQIETVLSKLPALFLKWAKKAATSFASGIASIPGSIASAFSSGGGTASGGIGSSVPGAGSGSGGVTGSGAGIASGPMSGGQSSYTQAQLARLWIQEGGNPTYAHLASAVAMAESGGRSKASNRNTNGSTDEGLWQINTVHGSQATYDVFGNTKSAISISKNGSDWGAWVTYNKGSYRQFMAQGGIVNRPTNILAGEAGPEAIIPLSKWGGGGGGHVYNINVHGFVGGPDQMARQVRDMLVTLSRREPLGI